MDNKKEAIVLPVTSYPRITDELTTYSRDYSYTYFLRPEHGERHVTEL